MSSFLDIVQLFHISDTTPLSQLNRVQETYAALESKVKQEVLRRNVLRVLRIWRSWFIFSDDFCNGLQVAISPPALGMASISQRGCQRAVLPIKWPVQAKYCCPWGKIPDK